MALIQSNLIKQSLRGTWSRQSGYQVIVTSLVRVGAGGVAESRPLQAIDDPAVPQKSSIMPDANYNALQVTDISADNMKDPLVYSVVHTYSQPQASDKEPTEGDPAAAQISVDTVVVETEKAYDIEGQQIFTEHVEGKRVYGSVRFSAPSTLIGYRRREPVAPGTKSTLFVGALNLTGVFGDGPRTWMCVRLGGPSTDGGLSWMVNYAFQRTNKIGKDSDGGGDIFTAQPWDTLIVEKDDQGNFVKDPVMGAGKKIIRVQRPRDFTLLNLTF